MFFRLVGSCGVLTVFYELIYVNVDLKGVTTQLRLLSGVPWVRKSGISTGEKCLALFSPYVRYSLSSARRVHVSHCKLSLYTRNNGASQHKFTCFYFPIDACASRNQP